MRIVPLSTFKKSGTTASRAAVHDFATLGGSLDTSPIGLSGRSKYASLPRSPDDLGHGRHATKETWNGYALADRMDHGCE